MGGHPGAERLGLELTYWGDAVDGVLLDRLASVAPEAARAALAPTLYPGQGVASTNRALARRSIVLGDQEAVPEARWVVVSRRTAYWRPDFRARLAPGGPSSSNAAGQGVWLSALYELRPEDLPDLPTSAPVAPFRECHQTFNLPLAIRPTICRIRSERIER